MPNSPASFALYTALVLQGAGWILVSGLLGPSEPTASWRVSYFLIVHAVSFVAVALLAAYLSERVQSQTSELVQRAGAVARLQALNENINQ